MDIGAFWEDARTAAKLNPLQEYIGPQLHGVVPPEAYSLGDTPELADRLAELVVTGRKTATSAALRDYEDSGEPLPSAGNLAIVLDGAGSPHALIRTTDVRVVSFGEVDAEHAAAEGEGDGSLESWRATQREYFERTGGFAPAMLVVLERFELLYPSH